jgi:hypothetical protein
MHQILNYSPGSKVTATLQILNAAGSRFPLTETPALNSITFPNGTLGSTSAVVVSNVMNGVYQFKFTLPIGAAAVGNFLLDISYIDPDSSTTKSALIEIQVSAPLGNFTVSPA